MNKFLTSSEKRKLLVAGLKSKSGPLAFNMLQPIMRKINYTSAMLSILNLQSTYPEELVVEIFKMKWGNCQATCGLHLLESYDYTDPNNNARFGLNVVGDVFLHEFMIDLTNNSIKCKNDKERYDERYAKLALNKCREIIERLCNE